MIVGGLGRPNKIELFIPAEERDSVLVDLEKARSAHSCATLPDGNVLLVGGINIVTDLSLPDCAIIDCTNFASTSAASLPFAVNHHATTQLGDSVLLAGGSIDEEGTTGKRCLLYRNNAWIPVTALNSGRYHHAMAASDRHAFVLGGIIDGIKDIAEQFDPHRNVWTPLSGAPRVSSGPGAAFLDGRLFLTGGYKNSRATWIFDPRGSDWVKGPGLNRKRLHGGLVQLDGRLYAFGGMNMNDDAEKTVETWDAAANRWRLLPKELKLKACYSRFAPVPIC